MKRMTQYHAAVVLGLVIAVLAAPRCAAQGWGTVEFSPVMGSYVPTGQLPPATSDDGCVALIPGACNRLSLSREQNAAVALGGRVTAWVTKRIAVEGSLWYSPSRVAGLAVEERDQIFFSPGQLSAGPANIVAGNVRILVGVTRGAGTWAYFVAGPAFVDRFGDAYAGHTGTARLGGVVGAGAHIRVARSLALRAELEQYLYSFQGFHQRDLLLSLGLSVASRIGSATTP